MSKYRWPVALLVLASALAVGLLVPASAVAASATPFQASGTVWVASIPDPIGAKGPLRGIFPAEEVDGQISASDWGALAGADFLTFHTSEVTFGPNGRLQGNLIGTFSMATTEGVLSGDIRGAISGNWNPSDPENPEGTYILDRGQWAATSGTGVFEGKKAGGTWEAYLAWDDSLGTYAGTIAIRGTYK
jgi:hypothetical protein